ncbi:MAG: AAA family ATPase [Fimbriimonadaceae bacterium]|nr:AAA family ATPase [Fimbriimonadaceae bacterium]
MASERAVQMVLAVVGTPPSTEPGDPAPGWLPGGAVEATWLTADPAAAVALAVDLLRASRQTGATLACGVAAGAATGWGAGAHRRHAGPAAEQAIALARAAGDGQLLALAPTAALAAAAWPHAAWRELGTLRLAELGVQPVQQLLHPALPRQFPDLPTLGAAAALLPLPPAPLVGREAELRGWVTALAGGCRLLAVTGPGGVGKSRAALALAERLAVTTAAAAVAWVDLDHVVSLDGLVQRLARAVRLDLQSQPSALEQLEAHLAELAVVLVLDHADELRGALPVLRRLQAAAPGLTVVLTAQEPPAADVACFPLTPLAPPEAEQLCVSRALRRAPVEALDPPCVAALCAALHGVPLAVELAAARFADQPAAAILAALTARLGGLPAGQDPARQAVRVALEWSYQQLSEGDRRLLSQLTVFAGESTLAEAQAVCQPLDVSGQATALQDSGLVSLSEAEVGELTPLLLCGSVRAYAAERLADLQTPANAARQRHARHYLRLAEEHCLKLSTAAEAAALDALEEDFAELQQALWWASESAQPELCARLALVLHQACYLRGLWAEAERCLEVGAEALELAADQPRSPHDNLPRLAALLAQQRAGMALDLGRVEQAAALAADNLARRQQLPEPELEADAHNLLAAVAMSREAVEEVAAELAEALRLAPADAYPVVGKATHNLAWVAARRGDPELAWQIYRRSLIYRRVAGDTRAVALTLGNLGVLAQDQGDLAAARRHYLESLALRAVLRDWFGLAAMLYNLGEVLLADCPAGAAALAGQAAARFQRLRSPYAEVSEDLLRSAAERLGEPLEAVRARVPTTWEEALAAAGLVLPAVSR